MTKKEGIKKLEKKSMGYQLIIENNKAKITGREHFSLGVKFQGLYLIDSSQIRKHNKKNLLRYWATNFWKIKAPTKTAVWQRGKQTILQKVQ